MLTIRIKPFAFLVSISLGDLTIVEKGILAVIREPIRVRLVRIFWHRAARIQRK